MSIILSGHFENTKSRLQHINIIGRSFPFAPLFYRAGAKGLPG